MSATSSITDRDRRRACRVAHVFGVSATAAVAVLLGVAALFRWHPVPLPLVLAAGPAVALAAGLAADLAARPPRVALDSGWLAVSRLGRRQRVRTDRLSGLSGNPRVAGSIVLIDEEGNRAEIDIRCLVRNPLIWQRISGAVRGAAQRGSLRLADADSRLWTSVAREVAEADRRALAPLDFGASG